MTKRQQRREPEIVVPATEPREGSRLSRWWMDRDVRRTLEVMLDYGMQCQELAANGRSVVLGDKWMSLAAEALIERFGEASTRLPEGFHIEFPDVPWRAIRAMRVQLAHHYEVIDPEITMDVLFEHIPAAMRSMELDQVRRSD